jgi:hypothetical protein
LLKRDIPPRAAAVVLALVLIASVVSGRERPEPPPAVTPAARPAERATSAELVANLDLEKLNRAAKHGPITDLFAPANVSPSLPASSIPGKVSPAATPPLPFQYLGKLIDGDKTSIFLIRGEEHYSVEVGQTIDQLYRIERVTDAAVTFVYLPLGTRQILPLPSSD